ncbi:uncharacterized protein LOC122884061 [Xyrichtys novacula]|uniref:Uncharacterized protein LOC122884061 n=1 Tax=Xyrichtys novacula TaxID=13765 RepID=A0AAV1G257_XYRNO|nr:uncharacterized protein LOC122884061 [Xyrichtys novacula]
MCGSERESRGPDERKKERKKVLTAKEAGQKRLHTPPWQAQESLMCLLLHPGFISAKRRTIRLDDDGVVSRVHRLSALELGAGRDTGSLLFYWSDRPKPGWKSDLCSWGLPGRAGSLYRSCPISVFTRVVSDS